MMLKDKLKYIKQPKENIEDSISFLFSPGSGREPCSEEKILRHSIAVEEQKLDLPQALLIDDEPINIEVLSSMLEQKNIGCDSATSGPEGVKLVLERLELVKR